MDLRCISHRLAYVRCQTRHKLQLSFASVDVLMVSGVRKQLVSRSLTLRTIFSTKGVGIEFRMATSASFLPANAVQKLNTSGNPLSQSTVTWMISPQNVNPIRLSSTKTSSQKQICTAADKQHVTLVRFCMAKSRHLVANGSEAK